MDKETAIFLVLFLSVAIVLISLAARKGDKRKVVYVGLGFVGLFISLGVSVAILGDMLPRWLAIPVGFVIYSGLLSIFGYFCVSLVDEDNSQSQIESQRNDLRDNTCTDDFLGKVGISKTDLTPVGTITVDGKLITGMIVNGVGKKDDKVVILSKSGSYYKVEKIQQDDGSDVDR